MVRDKYACCLSVVAHLNLGEVMQSVIIENSVLFGFVNEDEQICFPTNYTYTGVPPSPLQPLALTSAPVESYIPPTTRCLLRWRK